jgi:hypothetical protein
MPSFATTAPILRATSARVIKTVPLEALQATLDEMELSLDVGY